MTFRMFPRVCLLAVLGLFLGAATAVRAGDPVKVEAKLIWATNHEKAPDANYKRADARLSEDLQRAFKWKNYFVIDSKTVDTPKDTKVDVQMSDQCRLKIKYLGGEKFEVWIWGTDPVTGTEKALLKGTQTMGANQKVLLMGVNDNQSGWVVKLCRDGN